MITQQFTLPDQIDCIVRELKFRDRTYSRLVAQGRMTQHLADHEIARMTAVLHTLETLRDEGRTQTLRQQQTEVFPTARR